MGENDRRSYTFKQADEWAKKQQPKAKRKTANERREQRENIIRKYMQADSACAHVRTALLESGELDEIRTEQGAEMHKCLSKLQADQCDSERALLAAESLVFRKQPKARDALWLATAIGLAWLDPDMPDQHIAKAVGMSRAAIASCRMVQAVRLARLGKAGTKQSRVSGGPQKGEFLLHDVREQTGHSVRKQRKRKTTRD